MKKIKIWYILIVSLAANAILSAVLLGPQLTKIRTIRLKSTPQPVATNTSTSSGDQLFDEVNPTGGFEINATYGDLGPRMVALGVIDAEKFTNVYAKSSQPLTVEQEAILFQGSTETVKITRENSYFLLNYFWALGLANKSEILDEGDMVKYSGKEGAGNFASTGGWSLSKGSAMSYYSKAALISLTSEQKAQVKRVALNIFRPCCNNSTAFPDCNHGMALLAVLELMASNGATDRQMYEAGKYFNAFWFPGNYYDLALYFKNQENLSFKDIDAQLLLSKEYSSATGAQTVKQWLVENGLAQQPPKKGGGCGI